MSLLSSLTMETAGSAKLHYLTSHQKTLPVLICSVPFIYLCVLSQFSNRQNLARAKWLLFLTEGNLDNFFADIYVPFNCEFLVARLTKNSVALFDVYRVALGKPLNDIYFGRWTLISGLVIDKASIYLRRSDLQGTLIQAVTADVSQSCAGMNCTLDF
jgi:hypothetical protein